MQRHILLTQDGMVPEREFLSVTHVVSSDVYKRQVHTLLKGVGKRLNNIGMRFNIAFLCGKSGIGNIAGILAYA